MFGTESLRAHDCPPRLLFVLAALVWAGCDSATLSDGPVPFSVAAHASSVRGPATFTAGRADLRNERIDANDSHVAATITVTHYARLEADVYDPGARRRVQSMDLSGASRTRRIESGYDAEGAPALSVFVLDAPEGDSQRTAVDEVRAIHLDRGALSFQDAQGTYLYHTSPGVGPSLASGSPSAPDVGTNAEAPRTEGIVRRSLPSVGYTKSEYGTTQRVTSVQALGNGRTRIHERVTVDDPDTPATTQRRTYRLEGEVYVLEQHEVDMAAGGSEFRLTGKVVTDVRDVTWFENPPRDAWRGQHGTPEPGANRDPYEPPTCGDNPDDEPADCGEGPPRGGGGDSSCSFGEGANIVYVHGINAGGDAWGTPANREGEGGGLRGKVRCRLKVQSDVAPTIGNRGLDSHDRQEAELDAYVRGLRERSYILVAHSQGGLISRRVAQNYPGTEHRDRVQAVVTIGTPHEGALIAQNSPHTGIETTAAVLGRGVSCRISRSACVIASALTGANRNAGLWAAGVGGTDAIRDLAPGSDAINAVNGAHETFPRYGIQHYIPKRWSFARVAGDFASVDGGPGAVRAVNVIYGAAIVGTALGFFPWTSWLLAPSFTILWTLEAADQWYNKITAGDDDRTDGIVQGASQVYPRATRNFTAVDPTSHPGEVNTEKSYDEVYRVLHDELGVQEEE